MNRTDYYKKIVFFLVIIGVGLVSRVAYEASSNQNAATSSLAFVSAGAATGTGMEPSAFLKENAFAVPADTGAAVGENISMGYSASAAEGPSFPRNNPAAPSGLQYEAALIADLKTGAIYFGENNSRRWPLASVTKLMAATVVMDNFDMNKAITITPGAMAVDPSEKTLRAGDTYTAFDLLQFLLLPSSNVAAEAFADSYGKTMFLDAMNARSIAWGMIHTHYDDPSGLSPANQSTADDLLLLAQKIYSDYPKILSVARTAQVYVTELNSKKKALVKSINDFAGEADFIGGKTGYTDVADGNLLSIFRYNGRPVLIIVLGTDVANRFSNTKKLYDWYKANSK